jgi:hypothetical protein
MTGTLLSFVEIVVVGGGFHVYLHCLGRDLGGSAQSSDLTYITARLFSALRSPADEGGGSFSSHGTTHSGRIDCLERLRPRALRSNAVHSSSVARFHAVHGGVVGTVDGGVDSDVGGVREVRDGNDGQAVSKSV